MFVVSIDHECRCGKECYNTDIELVGELVTVWAKKGNRIGEI